MPKKTVKKPEERKTPPIFTKYPLLHEIQSYLKQITQQFPKMIRLEQIGKSAEGRSIDMVVLQSDQTCPKNAAMIEGGIHAREWLAHTSVLYFIEHIIQHPEILTYMDCYIVPCLNPDGYVYSHTHKRLWRKNMNKNGCKEIENWGVDINRNFPFGYGLPGSSSATSSNTYRGKAALSEPESQSMERTLNTYGQYIKLYIAVHCGGNLIMYPWGHTTKRIYDELDLRSCGLAALKAMKLAFEDSCYKLGQLWKVLYTSSGGSVDNARGGHKIKFAYTMELHRGGENGFDPPPSKILTVGTETAIGIQAMIIYVFKYYERIDKRNRAIEASKKAKSTGSASSESADGSKSCDADGSC